MSNNEEDKYQNYYDILEISTTSNSKNINDGYIKAKNAYSPDNPALYSIMTTDECLTQLELIETAYSILSNPEKRKQYDEAKNIKQSPETYHLNDQQHKEQNIINNSGDISKIVANKKFILKYEKNPVFENEIENTIEFSGDFLKKIREYKNIDIKRMANMTRISKIHIKNLEAENLEGLPALAYVRGFVYQYAKCLKLDQNMVATSYLNKINTQKKLAS